MKASHTTCGAEIPMNVAHVKNHLDRKCTWKSTIKEIFSSLHWLSLETGWLTQLTAWSCWSRTHPLRPGSELWMPLPVSLNWTRKIRWFYTHSISSWLLVIFQSPELLSLTESWYRRVPSAMARMADTVKQPFIDLRLAAYLLLQVTCFAVKFVVGDSQASEWEYVKYSVMYNKHVIQYRCVKIFIWLWSFPP